MTQSVRAVLTAGSALFLLLSLSTCGNTGGGSGPDAPGSEVRVTEADSGQVNTAMGGGSWVAEARYGNCDYAGDYELRITSDSHGSTENGYKWITGDYIPFKLQLNVFDGEGTLSMGEEHHSMVEVEQYVGGASNVWAMSVLLPAVHGDDEVAVNIRNLSFDGVALEPSSFEVHASDTELSTYWLVEGCELSQGFTITGDLCFSFNTHGLPPDMPALQISVKR